MNHTPEPWNIDPQGTAIYVTFVDGYENEILDCWTAGRIDVDMAKANARRIVACVNACKGLETDDIESMVAEGKTLLGTMQDQLMVIQAMDGRIKSAEARAEAMEADRDKWREIAEELALQGENCRDYLIECRENVLPDGRERYARQRVLIQSDLNSLDAALARYKEAGE